MRASVRDSETLGSRIRHGAGVGAAALGTGLVAGAAAAGYAIKETTEAAEESNRVHDQTAAVLKSTGHAANVSQKDVEGLAGAISHKTGIDDEQIQSGSNLLLTFTNIRNEVGKGNDIFNRATETIVDMSAALGQDTSSSAIQLGKALNDPIKGITALQRVGVSFSEQKAEQIKQWVEEGDKLKAQKAILRELGTEFGGSAEAQATAMDKVKVSVGNVEESIGNVFLPLVEQGADELSRFVPQLQHTADGLAAIAEQKNLDLGDKLALGEDVLKRQWGDVPGEIGELLDEAVPVVAEHAGQMGVVWAKGMLHGFVESDPLGKAAILLVGSKALGGPAVIGQLLGAGKRAGSTFGGAAASEGTAAMAAGLGLSPRAAKVFGLIDKAKAAGKTIGKAGLALGVLEGFSEAMQTEEGADPVQNFFHGLSMGALPESKGIGNQLADELMGQWDDRLPELRHHLEAGLLGGLRHDRDRLAVTLRVAVDTGASEDRIDAIRQQLHGLDRQVRLLEASEHDMRKGIEGLATGRFTRLPDIKQVMQSDMQAIRQSTANGSQDARETLARNYRAAVKAIEVGMDRGVIKTKTGMEEIQRLTRQAHLVSGDDPWGIAKGFARTWDKAGTITSRNITAITRDLGKMPTASAQVTAQMMLEMARELRSKGQLSKAEVEKLRSAVVTKLGLMASQGGKKGDAFAANVGSSFGVLSLDVAEALQNIGVNVSAVLKELGAHNPDLQFTLQYFHAHGAAGAGGKYMNQVAPLPGQAQGGAVRVPGTGLQDTVPLAVNGALSAVVAPGEDLVVLTRHQRPMVDEALAYRWGVNGLPGFFSAYDRPHYMAKGGQLREPRLQGPDPLRSLGQTGIHRALLAGQHYIDQHRPHVVTGTGVPGYTGPPANMKLLGDNEWVDSHTLAVTAYLDKKFGLTMSSGFRSAGHNAAIGGAPGSLHTHGSPSNPGATDSVGSMGGMQAYISFARQHVAGLQEAMVDNYAGLGYNAHLGFFSGGGVVTGKVSYFEGGATAGGSDTSRPGVALNLDPSHEPGGWNNETTQGWMEASNAGHPVYAMVTIGGKSANLPITDLGPASWTGRSIDVTLGGVRKLGLDPGAFPTDTIGKAVILDGSGSGRGGGSKGKMAPPKFHPHPGRTGKGGGTEGPGGKYPKGSAKSHGESVPGAGASPLPPGASALPEPLQRMLTSPGITYSDRVAVSDIALQQAEGTEDKGDDRAAYAFQEELFKRNKRRLQKKIAELRRNLSKRHAAAQDKKWRGELSTSISELGSVEGSLAGVRSSARDLNEGEAGEDPAVKAAEEQQRAAEELKASIDALRDEVAKQVAQGREEMAIGLAEARRGMADMIAGELGPRVNRGGLAVSTGTVGSS
jgi:hypothetical protein